MTLEKEGRAEEVGQVAIMHKVEEEQKVAKEVKEAKAVAAIEKTITNRDNVTSIMDLHHHVVVEDHLLQTKTITVRNKAIIWMKRIHNHKNLVKGDKPMNSLMELKAQEIHFCRN
jgi:hypothetical protein